MVDASRQPRAQDDDARGDNRAGRVRTFEPGQRPEVLVHVAGDWHGGELRRWAQDADGEWWADVTWRRPLGQTFSGTFPRQRVWDDGDDAVTPTDP